MYDDLKLEIKLPMSETMFLILLSFLEERYGYEVMQYVYELTDSRVCLGAGTLYQTISKLKKSGLIKFTKEVNKQKRYLITNKGKDILDIEVDRICKMHKIVEEYYEK